MSWVFLTGQHAYKLKKPVTWNMGTTGNTVSRADRPIASGIADASECSTVDRREYNAPFGLPVVPEM
jgi:hypothetical protein